MSSTNNTSPLNPDIDPVLVNRVLGNLEREQAEEFINVPEAEDNLAREGAQIVLDQNYLKYGEDAQETMNEAQQEAEETTNRLRSSATPKARAQLKNPKYQDLLRRADNDSAALALTRPDIRNLPNDDNQTVQIQTEDGQRVAGLAGGEENNPEFTSIFNNPEIGGLGEEPGSGQATGSIFGSTDANPFSPYNGPDQENDDWVEFDDYPPPEDELVDQTGVADEDIAEINLDVPTVPPPPENDEDVLDGGDVDNNPGTEHTGESQKIAGMPDFIWPCSCTRLTDVFGYRSSGPHGGLDIACGEHEEIWASYPGTVDVSGINPGGYGEWVRIKHEGGWHSIYGHLVTGSRRVSVGDVVKARQTIGIMGSTGRSSGTHLHIEWQQGGKAKDLLMREHFPKSFYQPAYSRIDNQTFVRFHRDGGPAYDEAHMLSSQSMA